MSFANIPAELQELNQWVVWRLELVPGRKPTKVPHYPGGKASVTNPKTWLSFADACAAPLTCVEACEPDAPISETGYTGVGFVFTANDPYCFIDLDDTHGDREAFARQLKVYNEFNSYSERSPSGTGVHIIIRGSIPRGRRRADIEIYCTERYATFTGDVLLAAPIAERQELITTLFDQMGGGPETYEVRESQPETMDDDAIISRASSAVNGEKFSRLFSGDWHSLYPSQSEADLALTDIIAFYTQNHAQIARVFRRSALGQREKAQRDAYIGYMLRKAFDKMLPPLDVDGLLIALDNRKAAIEAAKAAEPVNAAGPVDQANPAASEPDATTPDTAASPTTPAAAAPSHDDEPERNDFPPGLLGDVANFFLEAAPRQVPDIALAGAVGLLSGICGRSFNVSGTGLNQYILLLAGTGTGKDLITSGVNRLMGKVVETVPSAADFRGPGELVSGAGLIRWLNEKPMAFSILGEFGVKMKEMASAQAGPNLAGLERVLLQLYTKSGSGQVFDPSAYSDSTKNTNAIHSPSFTLLGETVPDRFFAILDDTTIESGLIPRFLTFEYKGKRLYLNEGSEKVMPTFNLVAGMADLCTQAITLAHNGHTQTVELDDASARKFREFERWTTDEINDTGQEVLRHLWNRAHLKALKLAAIASVGINRYKPVVDINATLWATNIVVDQTKRLIAKFETGQIGHASNPEGKQLTEMVRIIGDLLTQDFGKAAKYGMREDMHKRGVIPESVISRKLIGTSLFRNDRMGATHAIKRALKMLCEADELREMPKAQMQEQFGCGPRAYVIANAARFLPLPGA